MKEEDEKILLNKERPIESEYYQNKKSDIISFILFLFIKKRNSQELIIKHDIKHKYKYFILIDVTQMRNVFI
jgi:hypothetical protein